MVQRDTEKIGLTSTDPSGIQVFYDTEQGSVRPRMAFQINENSGLYAMIYLQIMYLLRRTLPLYQVRYIFNNDDKLAKK